MAQPLEDYVEVSERIEKFYERFPEGSLRCKQIRMIEVGADTFLVYVAQAFRTADDEAPAEGSAWEPVPGKTNFTRDSELMNAETSAWGRAIAALGFEVKRGIASRQEVQNRRGPVSAVPDEASAPQKRALTIAFGKAGVSKDFQAVIAGAFSNPLTKKDASHCLDILNNEAIGTPEDRAQALIDEAGLDWPSDIPADTSDLPPAA